MFLFQININLYKALVLAEYKVQLNSKKELKLQQQEIKLHHEVILIPEEEQSLDFEDGRPRVPLA